MPVIRGHAQGHNITPEERQKVVEQLTRELSGEMTSAGPVIFEVPFEQQDRIDVIVVWDVWERFGPTDRSNMILEAYKDSGVKIAQPLGVTYNEAIEQQVLPYSVVPMIRAGELDVDQVNNAMVAEGGFALENGNVDLRFPSMELAEQAHKQLTDALPKGYWSIVQAVGYVQ